MPTNHLSIHDLQKLWNEEFFFTKHKTLEIKAEILALKLSINALTQRWDALEKSQDFISMKYDTLIETIQQFNV